MTEKLYHVNYATELYDENGPTGEIREVTELAVVDNGGNELWRGTPGQEPTYQIQTRLRAIKTNKIRVGSFDVMI